jgi:hypothetical protein
MSKAKMRIQFISQGFHDILCSDGTKGVVEDIANGIKSRADGAAPESEGYSVTTMMGGYGGGRWVSFVQTTGYKSKVAEAEHNSLSGAIGG